MEREAVRGVTAMTRPTTATACLRTIGLPTTIGLPSFAVSVQKFVNQVVAGATRCAQAIVTTTTTSTSTSTSISLVAAPSWCAILFRHLPTVQIVKWFV